MSILDFLFGGRRQPSATVAKERLQILVAQERAGRNAPDFLPLLQQEVLAVVAKYLEVDDDMIKIRFEKSGETSTLEINVELDKAHYKTLAKAADKPAPISKDKRPGEVKPTAPVKSAAGTKR